MSDETKELTALLSKAADKKQLKVRKRETTYNGEEDPSDDFDGNVCQWATPDGKTFVAASYTTEELPPGCYEIAVAPSGNLIFVNIPVKTEELIRFPDSNSDKVIEEIRTFWKKRAIFKKHGIPFKRGICLWGPPGSGKSCTVQFIMKDIIEQDGLVVKFTEPRTFLTGMRMLRQIQPKVAVVVVMEDIDAILEMYNESDVLNLLDGLDQVENVVFLATTNYPEKLGARVINRPSRFDKRFKIGYPNEEARRIYFDKLFREVDVEVAKIDLDRWVKDTTDLSIAHLKELFVAVYILGDEYDHAITTLKAMSENISSDHDEESGFGFK